VSEATASNVPAKVRTGPALVNSGPNARPGRGDPLSSDFMTSSCSVNRVTIVVERRYAVQHYHKNWARFLTFEKKFASFDDSLLCWQWNLYGVSTEFASTRCIWQKWIIYPNTMARGPMQLHRLHRLKADGPRRATAQYNQIISAVKSRSRALATVHIGTVYISHSPCSARNASLVAHLHGCAIASSLKETFAQCKIFLGGTLAANVSNTFALS